MNPSITLREKTRSEQALIKEAKSPANQIVRISLLTCGILSSLFYVAMNILAAMKYESYNSATQTVSELSAINAPSRPLWISLISVYTLLVTAFGCGIWKSAGPKRSLRIVGSLLVAYVVFGFFWPPMHQREILAAGGATLTDILHILWTLVTIPLMLLIIAVGASAFGKRFQVYSVITIMVLLGFGALTGLNSFLMEANLPTPWMGVWERICIGAYMLWIVVLAITLLRVEKQPALN